MYLLFSDKERKVYEYVVRHFLACLSKDAEGEETIVNIEINNEKVIFIFLFAVYYIIFDILNVVKKSLDGFFFLENIFYVNKNASIFSCHKKIHNF